MRVNKANGLDKDATFAPSKIDGSAYLDIELVERFKPKLSVTFRLGTAASKHARLLIKLFSKAGWSGNIAFETESSLVAYSGRIDDRENCG